MAVALHLRLWNLGQPAQSVFDESYYTFEAVAFLGGGAFRPPPPVVAIKDDSTPEHPPLGKWPIAAGIGPYSKPTGWRLPSMRCPVRRPGVSAPQRDPSPAQLRVRRPAGSA